MKINNIIWIILFSSISFYAQKATKYTQVLSTEIEKKGLDENYSVWIFFKDKGTHIKSKLQTSKAALTEASIKRRKKSFKNKDYVTFYDIPVEKAYIHRITPYITKLRHQSKWLNAISVEIKGYNIEKIANFPFVKSMDIIRVRRYGNELPTLLEKPDTKKGKSTNYNLDYGTSITQLEQINVPLVHDMGYSGNGVIICVLDAGFNNLEHQAFNTMTILDSYDFVNDDNNVDDEGDMGNGDHGTMTLSTIGGFYEGQLIGPAYAASYLLAKTENTDSETQVEEDNWVAGAEWAEALGAEITSTSLGYIDFDDGSGYDASELDGNTATITIAADIMASLGVLVVNSAGNSGSGVTTIGAPADGNEVLAVGAVNSNGIRTSFSSVGPTGDGRIKPDVMAMGSGVVVADPSGNNYTTASGTSFSCPLTAGAAALLWEMVPTATNMELFEALKMSADNANSPNNEYGWGIIDIYAAYEYLTVPTINTMPLHDTENANGPYTVNAEVTSFYDLVNNSPKLYYRVNNGAWSNVNMSSTTGSNYTATIPGTGSLADYDYYITAENDLTEASSPENAPTNFYSFSSINDTEAPQVIHNTMAEYYVNLWNQAVVVATLTDNIGIDTTNSFVSWKINGVPQNNFNFSLLDSDVYEAHFPNINVAVGDLIAYKLIIQDTASNTNTTEYPTSGYQSFYITDAISFEQNQFSHNWQHSGHANWFITANEHQDGSYATQSGDISHYQNSTLEIDVTTNTVGTISFYKKVSSEENYDYLRFYINDVLQDEWSGEINWSLESYTVNPGNYHLKWQYFKDMSVSSGSDSAWIDFIKFPDLNNLSVTEIPVNSINIYPNPSFGIFNIESDISDSLSFEVSDSSGRILCSKKNTTDFTIDLSNYTTGIYIAKITQKEHTITKKLLVK